MLSIASQLYYNWIYFVALNFLVFDIDSSDCPPSFICIDADDSNVTECAAPINKNFAESDCSSDSDHNNVSG